MADTPRIEELKRRVHSDPASIAFAALAEEYRRAGRFEEAIATCSTGLRRHPSYLSAHVTLGRALIEVGRYAEAREELELVLRVAPENLAAIRGLAEIHHRSGDSHEGSSEPEPAAPAAPLKLSATNFQIPAANSQPRVPDPPDPSPGTEGKLEVGSWSLEADAVPPPPDPVLTGLETLLAAIVRARDAGADARG